MTLRPDALQLRSKNSSRSSSGSTFATSWNTLQIYITCIHKQEYLHTAPRIFAGKLSWDITTTQVNSALHPSGVTKLSTSFGWDKGGKVTSARWQVTLCDLIWHVISRSGVVISITNCYIRLTLLYLLTRKVTRH